MSSSGISGSFETKTRESRYSHMRTALRAWLVLGTVCGLLCAPAACAQAPQVSRATPSPAASASTTPSPSAPAGTLSGGWSDAGALSTARYGQLAVPLQGGRVLVIGVSVEGGDLAGNVDIYDPANGWSLGPKLPSERSRAAAAPLPGGRALLAGGSPFFQGDSLPPGPLKTALIYNPTTGTWIKAPNMSVARTDATATALPDGRVLVAGGFGERLIQLTNPSRQGKQILPLATSQFFNPSSSAWTSGPTLARGRFGHSAVALKGGQVLVVGGADRQDPYRLLNSAELFDPATGKWLGAGSIGAPRSQFTLTALADGRALLAGGLAADGSTVLRSTLLYDPAKNVWSQGPDLADARTGHAAAILADGRVLVTGGADLVGRIASSELLDPSGRSWSATGALATPRSSHIAVSLSNGRVLVIGGNGSGDPLASSELFDPVAKGLPAAARVPAGPGRWQLAAAKSIAVPDDGSPHPAQLLPDGNVLMLQAYGDFNAQVYDPKLDAWTTPFSRKAPPCSNCGIGSPSPPVFIAAPLGSSTLLLLTVDPQKVIAGKAEVIDLKTGTATQAASPGKIGYVRLELLPDGRIWRTALQDGDRHAFLYNPTANRWTATADVPLDLVEAGGDFQAVTPIPAGRVLVVGGLKAMTYDPASGHWANAGSFPNAGNGSLALGLPSWSGFSATGLKSGDVLLAGGSLLEGTTSGGAPIYVATSQVMRWDHSTGLLAPAENMPVANSGHSTAVLADGRVLVAGGVGVYGVHTSPDPVARAQIYDPAARAWSSAAPLPAARSGAVAITLADGRVLLVGGYAMVLGPSFRSNPLRSLLFTP